MRKTAPGMEHERENLFGLALIIGGMVDNVLEDG